MVAAILGLTPEQLARRTGPAAVTVRQLPPSRADSHLNAYVRFKLALTEDIPRQD